MKAVLIARSPFAGSSMGKSAGFFSIQTFCMYRSDRALSSQGRMVGLLPVRGVVQ
jgi:hypothetical protein